MAERYERFGLPAFVATDVKVIQTLLSIIISLVTIRINCTERRLNDFDVHA